MSGLSFFATAPRGFADLLARELTAQGAQDCSERPAGVQFQGTLETGYRACLWSRTASRVLLQLAQFEAASADAFYAGVRAQDWSAHIDPARTIACEFTGEHPAITHTHYGALRLKDGICDALRAQTGARPDVALVRPAVRVIAHAYSEGQTSRITLSLDLAGEGLHRRGYRLEAGEAPLRENLAAGLLLRARWDALAARGAPFLDPLCGAGTIVIEAALIAAQRAPGLRREYFGFQGWRGHDEALWQRLRTEAAERALPRVEAVIRGSDADPRAISLAIANAERAEVGALVRIECQGLALVQPAGSGPGLVCTNPPYGERLGDQAAAQHVYAELGEVLRTRFAGWEAAILCTGELARALQLRSFRVHEFHNGAIPCRLLRIDLADPGTRDVATARAARAAATAASPGAQMFANRLRKNLKLLGRAAQRAAVSCYRIYDADMPEYAFAIDRYAQVADGLVHLHVQEYAAPPDIEPASAQRRRREALSVLPEVFGIPAARIHVRLRQRQSGSAQYGRERPAEDGAPRADLTVEEGGLQFLVNLEDYLDTGLFLDHRLTRAAAHAGGRGALPEPVLLHRHGERLCGRRWRDGQPEPGSVQPLPGLGRPQLRAQRTRSRPAPARARRLLRLAAGRSGPDGLRPDLPRPADVLEFQQHDRRARRAARPPRADRGLHAQARTGRLAGVLDQCAALPARAGGQRTMAGGGPVGRDPAVRLRAPSAHPPLLPDHAALATPRTGAAIARPSRRARAAPRPPRPRP
jgi:23S rRNA (guanine2445-N2)-methyltransferase / 23S rRNA (guanine2069-N7)-methyltransferase